MKVLIIGRGGREHAIAWKIKDTRPDAIVYLAPGNAGTEKEFINLDYDESYHDALIQFAKNEQIDLTIVGPEVPLIEGIVDLFKAQELTIFGPKKQAAQIEGSKAFAKQLMQKYQIPTAAYQSFDDAQKAIDYVDQQGVPIVIKYDGLAAGKGVVVAQTKNEAQQAIHEMLVERKYGNESIIIEEFLEGPEFSLMAFVNGLHVYPMEIAQDHKKAYDNDLGPNTGGMGAYSPVSIIPQQAIQQAIDQIMIPTAKAMVSEGASFTGILYGGLILTKQGPKVIEFNARFGDPETEVILPRLENDLVDVMLAVLKGSPVHLRWTQEKTVGVVLAAKGYPNAYQKHQRLRIKDKGELIFHMGTIHINGIMMNSGGRVLFVVGKGKTIEEAREQAYHRIEKVESENLFYRRDIAHMELKKKV